MLTALLCDHLLRLGAQAESSLISIVQPIRRIQKLGADGIQVLLHFLEPGSQAARRHQSPLFAKRQWGPLRQVRVALEEIGHPLFTWPVVWAVGDGTTSVEDGLDRVLYIRLGPAKPLPGCLLQPRK